MATSSRKPWNRSNPRKQAGKPSKRLTSEQKATAKARAKRGSRPYPNLMDNMRVASKKKSSSKKKSVKRSARKTRSTGQKRSVKKNAAKRPKKKLRNKAADGQLKDPKGGLTVAGRKSFASRDGSHLRPGVTKKLAEMTLTDMRRKGSWAVRFYGRKKLPPLIDSKGKPTRYALSAHAWGEPVPHTAAAARRIAAKGERLLSRYQRLKRKR